jgi:aryl-alcohol dehydrogenase-like predicted oxidoreductase
LDTASLRFKPRRALGNTGFAVTRLGIGDIADRAVPRDDCVATLRRALDSGLNLMDTAPGYESGYSEEIVGAALRGRREGVFVIDKIDHCRQPVEPQVRESLARLAMPSVDLFVFHGVPDTATWDHIAAPGGPMAELDECRRQGLVRFRGISAHDPEALRSAILSGLCDVVLFPVGPFCDIRYITEVPPLAKQRGVGTVCFKTFGAGKLLGDTEGYSRPLQKRPRGKLSSGGTTVEAASVMPRLTVQECLRYTMTVDPDVALLGMSFPNEQDEAFAAAAAFSPMSAEEQADLRRRAARAVEGKGRCWWNPPGQG